MSKLYVAPIIAATLAAGSAGQAMAQDADPLIFDPAAFTTVHVSLDGQPIEVRRYRLTYVAKPVPIDTTKIVSMGRPNAPTGALPAAGPGQPVSTSNATAAPNGQGPVMTALSPLAWQTMYVYVPVSSASDTTSAIILQVNNAGWMASPARDILPEGSSLSSTSQTDNTGAALKAGYIVVSVGTRGRGIRDTSGQWAGKAPAAIVDAKAAIRYLRKNDSAMPGSADRIVVTGTSGGGGLSVAVAASGNSSDYLPYLASVGAAGVDTAGQSTIRDDVFATIAYCPISDLGHADTAYEWQYGAVRTAANTPTGNWTVDHQAASATMAAQYADYLDGLDLKLEDGSPLTAATMPVAITEMVKEATEAALARGDDVPAFGQDFQIKSRGPQGDKTNGPKQVRNNWLTLEGGHVKSIDYSAYLTFVAANQTLKSVPAFDSTATIGNEKITGENTLFGSANQEYSNFTAYSWDNNDKLGDGSGRDDTGLDFGAYTAGPGKGLARQIALTSPIPYLRGAGATVAPYWYVRHGTLDRDTSFAAQVTLKAAVENNPAVKVGNIKLAWGQGHSGNYDVQEAYAWLAEILNSAEPSQ